MAKGDLRARRGIPRAMEGSGPPGTFPRCSFCAVNGIPGNRLIAGREGVHICYGCVGLCGEIVAQAKSAQPPQEATASRPVLKLMKSVARDLTNTWERR